MSEQPDAVQRLGFSDDGQPWPSEQVIAYVRQESDTVLLAFSGGKDSLSAWLALRPHFTVIPFYCYRVPDLKFIDRTLAYYEEQFDTHIVRVPNPDFYYMLNDLVWQLPDRIRMIEAARLPNFTYDDVHRLLKEDFGLPDETWVANGVRSNDNIVRRLAMRNHGPLNLARRVFYPVWDWDIARLHEALKASGLKLSVEYRLYGHSIGGLDYRFIKPIKDHYPEDWETIKFWFPLIEAELLRYEIGESDHGQTEKT